VTFARTLKLYYSLVKPGVLYGNAITAAAGFLFAAQGHINIGLFAALFIGSSLVIGAACALNNYLDRDIDSLMERTKSRAVASGAIPGRNAVIFSIVLLVIGMTVLLVWTNKLVVIAGLVGFIDYVWLYGALSKRKSIHGTLVGSISGAIPIFSGYVAVTSHIDAAAILVFLILFLWQMPEFYSISIYRRDEYKAAHVPVMSVMKGIQNTKVQIFIYTVLFVVATLLLSLFGDTSYSYTIVMGLLGLYWLKLASKGLSIRDNNAWARKMFKFSLIILLAFSFMISIDAYLP
jgi:protoheme IX farnesyltransferase